MALDTRVVELLGRHRLMGKVLRHGVEVAIRAHGSSIDVIACAEVSRQVAQSAAPRV
jgi:hypothetical protein